MATASKLVSPRSVPLDPQVKSWIDNVIVPALVREYIAEHGNPNNLAERTAVVPKCKANGRLSAEAIQ